MRITKTLAAALCFAALFSCTKENMLQSSKTALSFKVANELPADTKSALDANAVVFNPGDQIGVWDGTSLNCFTTQEGGASASFTGTAASASRYIFISPYNPENVVNGSVVTFTIPETQVATPGSADPKALVSIGAAASTDGLVELFNAVALVKVVVPEGLVVKEIQVGGGKGCNTGICGTFTFNVNDQVLGVDANSFRTSINLVPAPGQSVIAPGTYYVVVRPKSKYDSGFALAYVNENNQLCKRTTSTAPDIQRNHILPLGTLNTTDFVANTGTAVLRTSGDEVQFTGRVKKIAGGSGTATEANNNIEHIVFRAHSLWDGNFNNNNNAVSSGKGNTNIFAYVKGNTLYVCTEASKIQLQASSNQLLRDFKALKTVTFNDVDTEASTTFERMFSGCTALESVDFGNCDFSKVRDMQFMFQSITTLKTVRFGKTSTTAVTNFKGMFMGCTNMTELNLGPNFTLTHLADKTMCNNMFYDTAKDSNTAAGADPLAKCHLYMSQAEYDQCRQDKGGVCAGSALNPARFYFVPVTE